MRMPRKSKSPAAVPGFAEEAAPAPQPPKRKPMAQRVYEETHPPRRAVNLTASSYWLHEAKKLGLNLSKIFDEALEKATRDARRVVIEKEIAEYNEWHAKFIEENGLWSDGLRRF